MYVDLDNRTELDRNLVEQLLGLDRRFGSKQQIKLVGVPDVVADSCALTSMVNLYCKNLVPAQASTSSEPGLVVYEYNEPDGHLVRVH